jgi:hypothetical protein
VGRERELRVVYTSCENVLMDFGWCFVCCPVQVELLTHQKWSGAALLDRQMQTVTGGLSSTSAMGAGVTEDQFGATTHATSENGAAPIASRL